MAFYSRLPDKSLIKIMFIILWCSSKCHLLLKLLVPLQTYHLYFNTNRISYFKAHIQRKRRMFNHRKTIKWEIQRLLEGRDNPSHRSKGAEYLNILLKKGGQHTLSRALKKMDSIQRFRLSKYHYNSLNLNKKSLYYCKPMYR